MLSAHLAAATIAFYVLVYTLLLKRRTSQNVVWGGAAGCMPVMIGWSAVTGTIGWQALAMFAIIFFWTPPHTWALAMKYKEDYAAAGVPMLPVVATERQVTTRIVIYTWLTVAATLALIPAAGWLYAAVAVLAGAWFLTLAHRLHAGVGRGIAVKPLRLFLHSNNYLSAVFCALAVDSVIPLPTLFG
jgi:protoheme IX farnesyltransferase